MREKYTLSIILTCVCVLVSSCTTNDAISNTEDSSDNTHEHFKPYEPDLPSEEQNGDSLTVLGAKLKNPYTVKNMRDAYNKARMTIPGFPIIPISTTDLYVRFLPTDNEQLEILEADTNLILFDYPLDYEIVSLGDSYSDPSVNPEDGQWYYTSVPKNYSFPAGIQYEIIEELFLPGTYQQIDPFDPQLEDALFALEDESLRLTDNYETTPHDVNPILEAKKRAPKGHIKVIDTERGQYVPVEGVRVRTRRWFKYGYAWTNSDGFYKINRKYRRSVHYMVKFKNQSGFKLRRGMLSLFTAKDYRGKKTRNGIDINYSTNNGEWRLATVNNAVVKYRAYADQLGIEKPHSNLRIVVRNESTGSGAAPMLRRTWGFFGFSTGSMLRDYLTNVIALTPPANALLIIHKYVLPDVIIDAHSDLGTANVYHLVFHELGHASHFKQVGSEYWVKYINYIITYGAYGDGTGHNAEYCGVGEMWGNFIGAVFMNKEWPKSSGSAFYLFENESWFNPGFLQDVDGISDITTFEIFSSLTSSTNTFDRLKSQLKNKTSYDSQIDFYFNSYDDWP